MPDPVSLDCVRFLPRSALMSLAFSRAPPSWPEVPMANSGGEREFSNSLRLKTIGCGVGFPVLSMLLLFHYVVMSVPVWICI